MRHKRTVMSVAILVVLALVTFGSVSPRVNGLFDKFGDVNCEDEMARLDAFAVKLQAEPTSKGMIIFYGGQRFRGRLPKQGEAAARSARLKSYLVDRRAFPSDRVDLIDGGYQKEFQIELWVVPAGATAPVAQPTIPAKDMKFQKGSKANPRSYRCEI